MTSQFLDDLVYLYSLASPMPRRSRRVKGQRGGDKGSLYIQGQVPQGKTQEGVLKQ